MNTCATCKYQGEAYEHTDWVDGEPVTTVTKFHQCNKIYWDNGGDGIPRHIKAYIVDGSGYFAALRCRDDFGCVDWKAKE